MGAAAFSRLVSEGTAICVVRCAAADSSVLMFCSVQPNPRQQKIDHMVVLYQENRAADHLLGCVNGDREGFDGIPTGGRLINKVPFDPSAFTRR